MYAIHWRDICDEFLSIIAIKKHKPRARKPRNSNLKKNTPTFSIITLRTLDKAKLSTSRGQMWLVGCHFANLALLSAQKCQRSGQRISTQTGFLPHTYSKEFGFGATFYVKLPCKFISYILYTLIYSIFSHSGRNKR